MLDLIFSALLGPAPKLTAERPEDRVRADAMAELAQLCIKHNPEHDYAALMARFSHPETGNQHMSIVAGKLHRRLMGVAQASGNLSEKRRMSRVDLAQLECITARIRVNFERKKFEGDAFVKRRKPNV